jgi:hypothetical protein
MLGTSAWTCHASGVLEKRDWRDHRSRSSHDGVEFARISTHGAIAYTSEERARQQLPDAELQPGFFVGVIDEQTIEGESYVRTTRGIWFSARDRVPLTPSAFEGVELEPTAVDAAIRLQLPTGVLGSDRAPETTAPLRFVLPFGWVFVENAYPKRAIGGAPSRARSILRLSRLALSEVRRHSDGHDWYRTTDGWLSDRQMRVPDITTPPIEIGPEERWLDVDRRTQTLVAYVGKIPVFATLVSTGRGPNGGPMATPPGLHRIWVKLATSDMDNLDALDDLPADAVSPTLPEPYAVEAVPHVMFFRAGYGLHGTYWHDAFGTPKSHGCVNLSLPDAARLFEFTSPRLVPGWQAVHPYVYDPGTLVRVR